MFDVLGFSKKFNLCIETTDLKLYQTESDRLHSIFEKSAKLTAVKNTAVINLILVIMVNFFTNTGDVMVHLTVPMDLTSISFGFDLACELTNEFLIEERSRGYFLKL